ncbi:MAG: ABC transporter ATP-binding protein [Clostridiales bacterium]|jgi:ABC-2 type transport system ATP-binding protein|nr:ABC transporter ATP-binding protein [Clostridiales bacterium]OPZ69906.1 MAG: Daunorubicin/doxorubicin resistance ATP-binding protein DrrA [Firmicutes bacterium ADurb.Bin467]
MNAIEMRGLTRAFGERLAVDHLSLWVGEGEFFALLGQNGAGKTTAVRMLSCLLKPTAGDALVMGRNILTDPEGVKRAINLSPQETAVAPNLTVRENLEFIAQLYGADRGEARGRAEEMLGQFHLCERRNERAKKLSGGMQRRLSVAMALITRPDVLFLDEPTLGLDVRARRELWHFLEALKGRCTLVLTTHYLEEAEALSDRIAVMGAGRLKALGTAAELKEQTGTASLEDAFLKLTEAEAVEE